MIKKDYYDFSKGQNSKTSPLFIADNECELVQNYHMDNLGALTKRDGITTLVGQIVNNKPILGMYYFKDSQGTDYSNVLVTIDDASSTNSDIFNIESNAWANSKADDTAGALPIFTTFLDNVFRVNGAQKVGVTSDLATWTDVDTPDTTVPDLKTKYITVWQDRVYTANENGGTKYPSRLYWSSLHDSGDITWDIVYDYSDINPDDNDEITWIEPFGEKLLVFKNEAIYRWTYGDNVEPDKLITEGTPQGRTVKQTQGIIFFANIRGIYAYTGYGQPLLISKKIKDFTDAIPTLANMRAEVDYDHYYLYVGDLTVKGETYSNAMLVYTISLKAWHIETYPFEIKSMARFKSKTLAATVIYDSIYLGDDDGFVYRKETGVQDVNGTTATAINGRIVSKEYPLHNFPNYSIIDNLYFLTQKANGAKVNYRIDRGDWKPWKDLKQRITDGKVGQGGDRARTIQFSITDNSITKSQIEGLSIAFKEERSIRR